MTWITLKSSSEQDSYLKEPNASGLKSFQRKGTMQCVRKDSETLQRKDAPLLSALILKHYLLHYGRGCTEQKCTSVIRTGDSISEMTTVGHVECKSEFENGSKKNSSILASRNMKFQPMKFVGTYFESSILFLRFPIAAALVQILRSYCGLYLSLSSSPRLATEFETFYLKKSGKPNSKFQTHSPRVLRMTSFSHHFCVAQEVCEHRSRNNLPGEAPSHKAWTVRLA